jgi:hypothetical protein
MNFCAVEIITSIVTLNGISVPDESLETNGVVFAQQGGNNSQTKKSNQHFSMNIYSLFRIGFIHSYIGQP